MNAFEKLNKGIKTFRKVTQTEPVTLLVNKMFINTWTKEDIESLQKLSMINDVIKEFSANDVPQFQLVNGTNKITFTIT